MKVLGFVHCHYSGSYGKEALLSIRDFCDKVYVCHSVLPSHGHGTDLEVPETGYEIRKMAEEVLGDKLIFESWPKFDNEEAHRLMRYRYAEGIQYILNCDLDEVMVGIPQALKFAENHRSQFYGTRYYKHFIKGLTWYFTDKAAPIRLEALNYKNGSENHNLPLEVLHLSLCQTPEIIRYKISCFGHKNEVLPDFYDKWLNWSEDKMDEITNLHPTIPELWFKPSKYLEELPESLKNYKPKIKMKKKILLIPLDFHRHSQSPELFTDMLNSFLLVADTMLYQGDLKVAVDFKPDLILFQGGLPLADCIVLKKETGALFCMQTGDARYSPMQSLMDYRSIVDAYFVPFSGKLLDTYTTLLGKPCHFLWEYIQNWRFKTPKILNTGLIGFVGNIYDSLPGGESREKLKEIANKSSMEINLRGSGFTSGTIPNEEVPDFYNNCYGVIAENNHNFEDYFTPRNLGGLAAGSCTLMRYFPGIEKFFQDLVHCIYYRDDYELLSWIEYLKNNPQVRNTIASQGHGLACANFTLDNWVLEFMKIINKSYIK